MKRWLLATLGASDIQYVSDRNKLPGERRFSKYSEECEEIWHVYFSDLTDNKISEVLSDLDVPLISALLGQLKQTDTRIDEAILIYTLQDKPRVDTLRPDQDTYWAFRIIKSLAEQTDYFGYRFRVQGVHAVGNPADLRDMMVLYKDVCTYDAFVSRGIGTEDELYATFTAGTPAMQMILLQAFSSLQHPQGGKYYYQIFNYHLHRGTPSVAVQIAVAEMLRHDEVLSMLRQMLSSRQFVAARQLLQSVKFTFLREVSADVLQVIAGLHHRYLFRFHEASASWRRCRSALTHEHFYKEGKHELQSLCKAVELLKRLQPEVVSSLGIHHLIAEYVQKVMFFWRSEQWNEFVVMASSFYEWILKLAFIRLVGAEYAAANKDKRNWMQYLLRNSPPVHLVELKRWVDKNRNNAKYLKADRLFFIEVICLLNPASPLVTEQWGKPMSTLYTELRNYGVHQLTGTSQQEVINILGEQWPQATINMLKIEFGLSKLRDCLEEQINALIEMLERVFYQNIGPSSRNS